MVRLKGWDYFESEMQKALFQFLNGTIKRQTERKTEVDTWNISIPKWYD